MDSVMAFAMGQANKGKPLMVFDWDRAARLIRERGAKDAAAGLASDWEWTGGSILRDGQPIPRDETYTYLASVWAVPELEIDGERVDCFVMEDERGWGSATYWPDSALAILRGED